MPESNRPSLVIFRDQAPDESEQTAALSADYASERLRTERSAASRASGCAREAHLRMANAYAEMVKRGSEPSR